MHQDAFSARNPSAAGPDVPISIPEMPADVLISVPEMPVASAREPEAFHRTDSEVHPTASEQGSDAQASAEPQSKPEAQARELLPAPAGLPSGDFFDDDLDLDLDAVPLSYEELARQSGTLEFCGSFST